MYAHSTDGQRDAEHALKFLECIYGSGKENMYRKATTAYEAICNDVIANNSGWHVKITRRILRGLSEEKSPIQKRGFALAAGVCGDSEITSEVVDVLCREVSTNADVETRRNLAISLSKIPRRDSLASFIKIMEALTRGMRDYTRDERGDIGSWVREASMTSAGCILELLLDEVVSSSDAQRRNEVDEAILSSFQGVMEQCCCRIDRTREVAGSCLQKFCKTLISHKGNMKTAKLSQRVAGCFGISLREGDIDGDNQKVTFGDAESTFSAVLDALQIEGVSDVLLVGLVSASGAAGSQAKAAMNALVKYFRNENALETKREKYLMVVQLIENGEERLIIPTFSALEALFAKQALGDVEKPELIHLARVIRASWRKKLRMIRRTVGAVQLLGELAGTSLVGNCFDFRKGSVGRECLEALMVVLGGSIPRLRRITADCIYMILIQYAVEDQREFDEEECSYVQCECPLILEALNVLTETEWVYLSTADARKQRNLLCKLLQISGPLLVKSALPVAASNIASTAADCASAS